MTYMSQFSQLQGLKPLVKSASDLTPKARQTRTSLIKAARTVIGEKGVSGVRVMEVSEAADVGRTSFYNYFVDSDDLVAAVIEEAAQSLKDRFDALHRGVPRGLQRLELCLEMILALAADEKETAMLITSLFQFNGTKPDLLHNEIEQELQGAFRNGELSLTDDYRRSLTQFVEVSTMAICREIALGRMKRDEIAVQVTIILNACRSNFLPI